MLSREDSGFLMSMVDRADRQIDTPFGGRAPPRDLEWAGNPCDYYTCGRSPRQWECGTRRTRIRQANRHTKRLVMPVELLIHDHVNRADEKLSPRLLGASWRARMPSLTMWMVPGTPVRPSEIDRPFILEVARLVDRLHGIGVRHRDLKLGNMVWGRGGGRRLMLIDYGMSCWWTGSRLLGHGWSFTPDLSVWATREVDDRGRDWAMFCCILLIYHRKWLPEGMVERIRWWQTDTVSGVDVAAACGQEGDGEDEEERDSRMARIHLTIWRGTFPGTVRMQVDPPADNPGAVS